MTEERPTYRVPGRRSAIRDTTRLAYADPAYEPPTPDEIRTVLRNAELTGSTAGGLLGVSGRTIRKWTGGEREMPYCAWRLLLSETGQAGSISAAKRKAFVLERDGFEQVHHWIPKGTKTIYKFLKFDERRLPDLLTEGRLYFPMAEQLNDPWENRLHCRFRRDDGRTFEMHKRQMEALNAMFRERRMYCLTAETHENALMWSYYADGHKGICVGFDATKKPFQLARSIRYTHDYPSVSLPPDPGPRHERSEPDYEFWSALLTKSQHWDHEAEYRILDTTTGGVTAGPCFDPKLDRVLRDLYSQSGYWRFEEDALTHIYLGASMCGSQQDKVLEMIDGGPFRTRAETYKAELSQSEFTLSFVRV